jgi:hypothetical protein
MVIYYRVRVALYYRDRVVFCYGATVLRCYGATVPTAVGVWTEFHGLDVASVVMASPPVVVGEPFQERPDQFNALVDDFWRRVDGTT